MGWVLLCLTFSGAMLLPGARGSNPAPFPGSQAFEAEYLTSVRTGYTCEGEDLEVQCDPGQLIQIVRANYGRFSIALCNEDGQTHWSVNCMAPHTKQILQKKCDSLNSCQVAVSSSLFEDPCPGTRKYLEIHYLCSSSEPSQPLASWVLQNSSRTEIWLQKQHKEKDLKQASRSYNSRIPILVATTTATPKRIPITTPIPTSTTTATTTTTTTTPKSMPAEETTVQAGDQLQQDQREEGSEAPGINEELWMPQTEAEEADLPPAVLLPEYCPATTARNLVWKYTKRGSNVVQPCPNGATGLARWSCSRESDYAKTGHLAGARWDTPQPDMSDCKSSAITNLEVKLRQSEQENVIASSLVQLTGSRKLYGGDLESVAGVMKTVANRIQYLLQQRTEKFYKKEAYIQEILLNIVRSGCNLLDVKNKEAWSDLDDNQKMKIASSLLQALEDNAMIFAGVTNQPEVLMESSYNILMAISVLHGRSVRNGTVFPTNKYEEPFGTIEDSVFLPSSTLRQSGRDTAGGIVKVIFFSYKHVDEIIAGFFPPRFHKQLNSRVMSVSLEGRGGGGSLAEPVRISLKHLREEGMVRPACVAWDREAGDWTDSVCRVVQFNRSRTVCECTLLSSYALLMEEEAVTTLVHLPDFHVEIIAASIAVGVILILIVVALKWRAQVQRLLLSPCSKKEKKGLTGLDTCSKSQSFFTGLDILQSTGTSKNPASTISQQDQTKLSQYVMKSGTPAPVSQYPPGPPSPSQYEGFESGSEVSYTQSTLLARPPYPIPSTHITLNPYSTQLVDNINRMMAGGREVPVNHIYQVAMSPQLSQLTNTLKKKKCLGGHPGPCHHRSGPGQGLTDSSVHSESGTHQVDLDTEMEMVPNSSDVVFRAVSPHGHVYWEIDPKRGIRQVEQSDSDTNNDMHNMSDFSEEDGRVISDRSRQSSSRFSDNRPLISGAGHMSLQLGAMSALNPLPENSVSLIQFSPHRFSSLHRPQPDLNPGFSTRTRLRQPCRMRGSMEAMEAIQDTEDHCIPEQVQRQVQIPDLRRIPVSVKSSEYIMAKIQSHMDQRRLGTGQAAPREREV